MYRNGCPHVNFFWKTFNKLSATLVALYSNLFLLYYDHVWDIFVEIFPQLLSLFTSFKNDFFPHLTLHFNQLSKSKNSLLPRISYTLFKRVQIELLILGDLYILIILTLIINIFQSICAIDCSFILKLFKHQILPKSVHVLEISTQFVKTRL